MVDIPRMIFSDMTKSLGKRAFSDSLLGNHPVGILSYKSDIRQWPFEFEHVVAQYVETKGVNLPQGVGINDDMIRFNTVFFELIDQLVSRTPVKISNQS